MAKIKLPKKPHSRVIFLTPREIIELEVMHISIKTHVSRQLKTQ